MDLLRSAGFTVIPWLFATVADLLVGGMVTGLSVVGAGLTHDPYWAIFWITLSLGGLAAAAPASWSLPSLIAPKGGAGTIGGMMNFINSISGLVAPAAAGQRGRRSVV